MIEGYLCEGVAINFCWKSVAVSWLRDDLMRRLCGRHATDLAAAGLVQIRPLRD